MNTSPIKRNKALVPLSKEHHFDLLLVWKFRRGIEKKVDFSRMTAYLHYLDQALLSRHFQDEEELLFNQLTADIMCTNARKQHQQLRQLIIQMTSEEKPTPAIFSRFCDLLETHVRYEERELFPYLEKKLSPEYLSTTEKKIEERHSGFQENWPDEFWK